LHWCPSYLILVATTRLLLRLLVHLLGLLLLLGFHGGLLAPSWLVRFVRDLLWLLLLLRTIAHFVGAAKGITGIFEVVASAALARHCWLFVNYLVHVEASVTWVAASLHALLLHRPLIVQLAIWLFFALRFVLLLLRATHRVLPSDRASVVIGVTLRLEHLSIVPVHARVCGVVTLSIEHLLLTSSRRLRNMLKVRRL